MIEDEDQEDEDITEDKIHLLSKKWIDMLGYTEYKGVCNKNKTYAIVYDKTNEMPLGKDVPVPHEIFTNMIQIDHQAEKIVNNQRERRWIEDKGNIGMSKILEGFIRVCFAVYYGGGDGLLSLPSERYEMVIQETEFFSSLVSSLKSNKEIGKIGLLDSKKNKITWL